MVSTFHEHNDPETSHFPMEQIGTSVIKLAAGDRHEARASLGSS